MKYVTFNTIFNEGLGSLLQNILSVYYYSKINNLIYIHTPLKNIEHCIWNNMSQHEWDAFWNNIITNNFLIINQLNINDIPNKDNTMILTQNFGKNFLDTQLNLRLDILNELSNHYIKSTNIPIYFKSNDVNIALHVRRFTNTDCDDSSIRKLYSKGNNTDNYFYNMIINLKSILTGYNCIFHIYTQVATNEDHLFSHYLELNKHNYSVVLHKGENTFEDLHHMIISDILVMSLGSFSIIGNYYNKNICICPINYHSIRNDTIIINHGQKINHEQEQNILLKLNIVKKFKI